MCDVCVCSFAVHVCARSSVCVTQCVGRKIIWLKSCLYLGLTVFSVCGPKGQHERDVTLICLYPSFLAHKLENDSNVAAAEHKKHTHAHISVAFGSVSAIHIIIESHTNRTIISLHLNYFVCNSIRGMVACTVSICRTHTCVGWILVCLSLAPADEADISKMDRHEKKKQLAYSLINASECCAHSFQSVFKLLSMFIFPKSIELCVWCACISMVSLSLSLSSRCRLSLAACPHMNSFLFSSSSAIRVLYVKCHEI